ncbi:pollen-specific leucine-rich repeat extensin-like protein 2 [Cocos nucifera]|uniref:Pollen-specific leucine-rich repeat extensin-like protein 2 n=1 Tax=Cocos nucifera TaxID=13894 RepID=A0A8K0I9F2_COCNU|nr:pollen-specific leucine-rich repeat extensin-like protein 2 [Cocos nucifera]
MDKQILGLSGSQQGSGGEFFDLMNPEEEHQINGTKEEIFPSYDFQPIRTVGSSPPTASAAPLLKPSWGSVDSKMASSNLKNAGILEPCELTKVSHEKEKSAYDAATVVEIDRTVKKYADNLLHMLEGVSSRLMQLESRTCNLESSVDELKVQTCVQVLRDKQEIVEAQLQLANLQASRGDNKPQQSVEQSHQLAVPPSQPTMLPALPAPNAPPPPAPHQNLPPQLHQPQIPSVPCLPREPYFPSQARQSEATHQQYQVPVQQPHPPPPSTHHQPSTQLPQYSQPPRPPQPVNPSAQLQSPLPPHPEESVPYMSAPQTYPSSIRQAVSFTQPPSGPSRNQHYGPNLNMFEPPTSRQGSGQPPYSTGYSPPTGPYGGSPSHRSSSAMKSSPFASSAPSSGGSTNYTRLPTAQILPQAQPTGSSSGGSSGNRVPMDDVVEKVATMGFSRDQVRAAVRMLTENGKSVDLNVVLDKLMNDGEIQPQKGWFGR